MNIFSLYTFLFLTYSCLLLFAESESCGALPELEANDDVTTTSSTKSTTFNILENDEGENLSIKEITLPPRCGEVQVVDADIGTILFTPDPSCFLTAITFEYKIEDIEGSVATANVHIVINEGENPLIVDIRKDCSPSYETGTYDMNIIIAGGTAPFIISGSINETLDETGFRTVSFVDGNPYEITITDATGSTFSKGDETSCTTLGPSIELLRMDEIADCICQGDLLIRSENFVNGEEVIGISGHWFGIGNGKTLQLGDTIPYYAYYHVDGIETSESNYWVNVDDNGALKGYVSTGNFCPNAQSIPPLSLNESESKTFACGEGEIVLSMEGGGEEANYNWYRDPALTIPANPPTGQTWINDEIGPRIIYVQATNENGCKSEQFAIPTYHYLEIQIEGLKIEVDESNCERYRVLFNITGGNGVYTVNGDSNPESFTSEWFSFEEDYSFVINDSPLIPNCDPITISGLASDLECLPVANNDFRAIVKDENTLISILANDTGKEIVLSSIVTSPQCGQIVDINLETGTVTYQGDINVECEEDSFTYEITDADGQTAMGTVNISFVDTSGELVVEVISDCSNRYLDGTVDLIVRVLGGVPPFEINGVIGNSSEQIFDTFQYTLDDFGQVIETFDFYHRYELQVTDAAGKEFTKIDDTPCCYSVEIVPYLDCFIEGEDTLAILTYELIDEDGNISMQNVQGNPQNDTLQNGEMYFLIGPGSVECGNAEILETVDCEFTSIENAHISTPNIQLFPNPNNGNFSLSLQLQQMEEVNIEVFDVVGRVKMLQEFEGSEELLVELDLGLSSGLYFVRVSGKDWTWTEKMIVE